MAACQEKPQESNPQIIYKSMDMKAETNRDPLHLILRKLPNSSFVAAYGSGVFEQDGSNPGFMKNRAKFFWWWKKDMKEVK